MKLNTKTQSSVNVAVSLLSILEFRFYENTWHRIDIEELYDITNILIRGKQYWPKALKAIDGIIQHLKKTESQTVEDAEAYHEFRIWFYSFLKKHKIEI